MISSKNLKSILSSILSKNKEEHDKDINHIKTNINKGWISSGTIENIHADKVNEDSPVGNIISVMGNNPPVNYLVCDGAIYNISDYQELADYFESEFGSCNKFGGDGTATFAVPDLRGEFLRGTGTNSHGENGSGDNVGIHQDATQIPNYFTGGNREFWYDSNEKAQSLINYYDSVITSTRSTNIYRHYNNQTGGENNTKYTDGGYWRTLRPTNTSVLYCIKYRSTSSLVVNMIDGGYYSTTEHVIGQWIDGKPLYRVVLDNNTSEPFQATLPKTSTKNVLIYTYTFTQDGSYELYDLQGYSEASSNEAFYKFYLNDEYICKKYIYTGTTFKELYGGDVSVPIITAHTGDVLTVKIDWDGTHSNNVFGLKGVYNRYPLNVERFIKQDRSNNIYEYTKIVDTSYDNDADIAWQALDTEVDEIINRLGE